MIMRGYSMYFEDFTIGQVLKANNVKIDKEKILAFAKEYDPLPIHLDEEHARQTGFGGLIAPGVMSLMLVWAEYAKMNIWGDALVAGKQTCITWFAPVYAGDILHGSASVTGKRRKKNNTGVLEIMVEIFNQNGILVITDISKLVIRCRDQAESDVNKKSP